MRQCNVNRTDRNTWADYQNGVIQVCFACQAYYTFWKVTNMELKLQVKALIHQILVRTNFYRLSLFQLTEILKLLEMPEASQPHFIQEHVFNGIEKCYQYHKTQIAEYFAQSKFNPISKETKAYVESIMQEFAVKRSNIFSPTPFAEKMIAPEQSAGWQESEMEYLWKMHEERQRMQQMYMYMSMPNMPPNYMSPPFGLPYGPSINPYGAPYPSYYPPLNPLNPLNPLGPLGAVPPPPGPSQFAGSTAHSAPTSVLEQIRVEPANQPLVLNHRKNTDKSSTKVAETRKHEVVELENPKKYPKIFGRKRSDSPYIIEKPSKSMTKSPREDDSKLSCPLPKFKECACLGYSTQTEMFKCNTCSNKFHYSCLKETCFKNSTKDSDLNVIDCYFCRMKKIDPLNRVHQTINECYLTNITQQKFSTSLNFKQFEHLCKGKNSKYEIELRCIRSRDAPECHEITWPDECIIKINGEKIIEIQALAVNSSLKKRKDYSVLITKNIFSRPLEDKITLTLEMNKITEDETLHKKIKNRCTFALGIYLIEKMTVEELTKQLCNEGENSQPANFMDKIMNVDNNDVEIDQIAISLLDPYTWDFIKTPVRGIRCKHAQCFDLSTFICFMQTSKHRMWKCPICSKDSRKFMLDKRQAEILNKVKEMKTPPKNVSIYKDDKVVFKVDKQSGQNEDQENDQQKSLPSKTKYIAKEQDL